ncbi:MAG TPA: hypothetical protein PLJ21_08240 [Pseudobdellovibrionaceae bacterium]|nr:hypothetical protein [Pseudobdellovibrionaceae bacterium]
MTESKSRKQLGEKAEASLRSVYERDLIRYKFGQIDLQSLLQSRTQYNAASIEALRSETQLSLNRIVLHRLVGTDQFSKVKECSASIL